MLHIDCLELLAVFHAVRAFAKDKKQMMIQIHLDNTTAVAYVNHLGGTKSLDLRSIAVQLGDWCLQKHLFLIASHIRGVSNTRADLLSRTVIDGHDWQMNPEIFRRIESLWSSLLVDLFASRVSRQTERFFSWKPDPLAEAVDAFSLDWTTFTGYANPPWSLVGRCIQQILNQGATIVFITPLWPTQA